MKATDSPYNKLDWISTGFGKLDHIMGGGIPSRRITELSGSWSVGKTTLALQIVAHAQKSGIKCFWCETERSFFLPYAESLGVNGSKLEFCHEEKGEDNLEIIEGWARENKNALIILDSVGFLTPSVELEKAAGQRTMAALSNLFTPFVKRLLPLLEKNNNAFLVINHQSIDMGNIYAVKSKGGNQFAYGKSVWLVLTQSDNIKKSDGQIYGNYVKAEIRKHKLAPMMRQKIEMEMIYGKGFSVEADLLQELMDKGEVVKKGNTYWKGEIKLGVGAEKAKAALHAIPA